MKKQRWKQIEAYAVIGSWGFTASFNSPLNKDCIKEVKRIEKLGFNATVVPCTITLKEKGRKL